MTIAELLAANGIKLDSTEPGRHYATCPRCSKDRRKPGHNNAKCLGVTIESDGRVHWGCNHCNWTGPEKGSGGERQPLTSYVYRDIDGVPRFRKVRNLPGRKPRFWLEQPNGRGGWKRGTKGINTKILYRIDEVTKAVKDGRIIACAEGEKDCDSLWTLNIPATCNAHGAHDPLKKQEPKWYREHSEQLRGADIVIFNDNDPAGYAHADVAARLSLGIAKRVRRLDLAPHWPDMPKNADVSDWLALGHTRQELERLIGAAPDYVPPQGEAAQNGTAQREPSTDEADAEIVRLAQLTLLQYEQERKGAAERLDVRASILDRLVQAERERQGLDDDGLQGRAVAFPEPEAWPEPIDGSALLDELATAIRKHVVMPDTARDACALWVVHTHLVDRFLVSPRLGVRSPTKGCGKTLLLDVLGRLVLRPLPTANVTASAIFRVVENHRPTLLVDEVDTFLHDNDELRGVLNSGHRKGGSVLRTVGEDHEPRAFATFSPCVIALIGSLPDTLHDRSVTIDLKRRLPSEKVEPFRPDRADHLDVLARRAARWAHDHAERVADMDPTMPSGIVNREADNWRPLLAIADAAGDEWPDRARKAATAAHAAAGDDDASRLELLLGDIRSMFGESADMASADLVEALVAIDGRPWAELGKSRKPLTQNRLARMLKPLTIAPGNVGPEDARVRGYKLSQFEEAFSRYLPPEGASKCTGAQNAANTGISDISKPHSAGSSCADVKCEKPNNDGLMGGCALSEGGSGVSRNGGGEPGLSERRIRQYAKQYEDRADAHRQATGEVDHEILDADLRQTLATEVLPEFIEVEVERVIAAVFGGKP